jgi:hypothetical protein
LEWNLELLQLNTMVCFLICLKNFYQLHKLYNTEWQDDCAWWARKDMYRTSHDLF